MDKIEEPTVYRNRITAILGLEALTRLLYIVLHIPFLADESPIGLMIISKPGMGKSMILSKFKADNCIVVNDITGYGLEMLLRQAQNVNTGYVIIPDFLRIMARKKGFEAFITLANIVLEEGVQGISRFDCNVRFKKPLKFGIITAMTDMCFKRHVDVFTATGFLSRFGVFSYSYEPSDCSRVEKMLSFRNAYSNVTFVVEPPREITNGKVLVNDMMAIMVRRMAKILAGNSEVTFRQINFLRKMLKARALSKNRREVMIEDVKEIFSLLPFFIPLNPSISTDLDYLIAKGVRKNTLLRSYTETEIYNATQRLIKKQIHHASFLDENGSNT